MSKLTDKYYLSIHHRSIAININPDDGSIEKSTSPGHFYVSLQKNEDKTSILMKLASLEVHLCFLKVLNIKTILP